MMTASEGVTSSDAGHEVRALNRIGQVMSNNKSKKNNKNRRQGRPKGFVPPRLADMKRAYTGDGVHITNMPQAVDYLDLIETLSSGPRGWLLDRALYRMTAGAFTEACDELALDIAHARLSWTIDDLPVKSGVVVWEGAKPFAGLAWEVDPVDGVRVLMLTSYAVSEETEAFTFKSNGEMPDFVLGMPDVGDSELERRVMAMQTLTNVRAILARIIIGGATKPSGDSQSESTGSTHSRTTQRDDRYEVRTMAECSAERANSARGGHAGWHLQHRSHTRGYFRKNGTWVEPFTRGKHLPERPRVITGTTVRAGVAA